MASVLKLFKNPAKVVYIFDKLGVSRIIPDSTYLKLKYRANFGKKLNLKNPQTYNEKLQWLKLYDRKPEYITTKHMEKLGYEKDTDWIELLLKVPEKVPEKIERIANMVAKRFGLKARKFKSNRELEQLYGKAIFDLVNKCYAPLYGFSPLSKGQIEQYIKMYLPLVDRRMIALITDQNDKLVGVGISIASLAEALQKAKGKLFPFGWFYIVKALFIKRPTRLDFLIVAIDPEYQGKGVNAIIINEILPNYVKMGFKDVESNPELENNDKVQAQWDMFDKEQHKRRRAYKKSIKD